MRKNEVGIDGSRSDNGHYWCNDLFLSYRKFFAFSVVDFILWFRLVDNL